jgi:hypothetical protein
MCIHPKTTRKETTLAQRAAIWTRYCSGYSILEIIALEGHPRSTIRSIIERREQSRDSTFKSKPRTGRLKKTTARDDRALLRAANRDTKATLFALATLSKSTHQLSRNTIRKILKAASKAKRKPCKKPFLKPKHKY